MILLKHTFTFISYLTESVPLCMLICKISDVSVCVYFKDIHVSYCAWWGSMHMFAYICAFTYMSSHSLYDAVTYDRFYRFRSKILKLFEWLNSTVNLQWYYLIILKHSRLLFTTKLKKNSHESWGHLLCASNTIIKKKYRKKVNT